MEEKVDKLMEGKMAWPAINITKLDPNDLEVESVREAMSLVFRVVGINAELLAKMTGYWNPTDNDQTVMDRARSLCTLYRRYNAFQMKNIIYNEIRLPNNY